MLQKSMEEIQSKFYVIKGNSDLIDADTKEIFTGIVQSNLGFEALFEGDLSLFDAFGDEIIAEKATLEDIMYFMTRKEN